MAEFMLMASGIFAGLARRLRWALVFFIGTTNILAQAQDVRLTHLLELAISRHPTVLQARSQTQSAGYDLDAAKWGRYPSLSSDLRSDSGYAQSIARIEQPVWAGGRLDGRIELGEANLRVAEAALSDAELNALMQVGTSFFEWLRLDSRFKSTEQNVQEHDRLFALISRRVKSEISPPADATLAEARLQQAITERLQIQRQLEATYNTLVQWAGPLNGRPVPPRSLVYKKMDSGQALVDRVLEVSAQRHKLLAQIESSEAQTRLAQAQGLPSVVVGYQYIFSGPLFNATDRGRTYLGLQYQPGSGLSALSGIKSAQAKKDAAEQELKALERNLEFQARTLYSDIEVLEAQIGPAQGLLEGTSELVESYLRQYQIGRKNWLEVLNAQREKSQAQYNLADVRYSLLQSQLKLVLLTGELNRAKFSVIYE